MRRVLLFFVVTITLLTLACSDARTTPTRAVLGSGPALPATWEGRTLATSNDQLRDLVAGDLDGDGDLDFVSPSFRDASRILWNDGTGDFLIGEPLTDLAGATEIQAADVNGDGRLDLIALTMSSTLKIALHQREGQFLRTLTFARPNGVRAFAALAWDRAQGLELVWLEDDDGLFVADLSDGKHNPEFLGRHSTYGWNDLALTLVQIDGRGLSDLVVLGTNMTFLRLEANVLTEERVGDDYTRILLAGDFDGDGRCDLLTHSLVGEDGRPPDPYDRSPLRSTDLHLLTRVESQEWVEGPSLPIHGFPDRCGIADLNGDGRQDLWITQESFYDMACFGGEEGFTIPMTWQAMLRTDSGWLLREAPPKFDWPNYPFLVAPLNPGAHADLVLCRQYGQEWKLVLDPFRP